MAEQGSRSTEAGGSASKRSSATKATSKKSTSRKSPTSKAGANARAPRAEPSRKPAGASVATEAARQFAELSAKQVEGVIGLRRTDEGWIVELDVLELRRVPETTDVLATYEVSVGPSGELEGYRRTHRYVRGQVEE
jgi:hypothetical protein